MTPVERRLEDEGDAVSLQHEIAALFAGYPIGSRKSTDEKYAQAVIALVAETIAKDIDALRQPSFLLNSVYNAGIDDAASVARQVIPQPESEGR